MKLLFQKSEHQQQILLSVMPKTTFRLFLKRQINYLVLQPMKKIKTLAKANTLTINILTAKSSKKLKRRNRTTLPLYKPFSMILSAERKNLLPKNLVTPMVTEQRVAVYLQKIKSLPEEALSTIEVVDLCKWVQILLKTFKAIQVILNNSV